MTNNDTPLPLSFRSDLLAQVMPALHAGECCSLVGTSGVGKSNLARFLRRDDVRHFYGMRKSWFILIDSHSLVFDGHSQAYVVLELMIHRLIMEAETAGFDAEFIGWADDLHSRLIVQPNAHLALRYLERLCARLCGAHDMQIVFEFDQFEDLWHKLDARFFLNLRNLRDQFKYRVVYLVMTRERLHATRDDLQEVESFWELFSSHTFGLGMYSVSDAQDMLARIALRGQITLEPQIQDQALAASGRHPGLLRAVFWALTRMEKTQTGAPALEGVPAVREECAKIWRDLTEQEQQTTLQIIADAAPQQSHNAVLEGLRLKELVLPDQLALFSPLFLSYARQQAGGVERGIFVNTRLRQVSIDGQPLRQLLSPLEFALLAILARNAGKVCSREEVLHEIYKEEAWDANDQRLDTIVSRLREALGERARHPPYLVTHRGVGFQLTHGGIHT